LGASVSAEDGRLSFEQALAYVQEQGRCAFAAVPVFADDGQTAEGARVFILERDELGGCRMRFVAGPFFSAALAADEIFASDQIPERVRELQFLPSDLREDWLAEQIQDLIAKLMRASAISAPHMPDYLGAPARRAAAEVSFPISSIGRGGPRDEGQE